MTEPPHPVSITIEESLRSHGCWYERFEHRPVRTSEEAAEVREGRYALAQGTKALIVRGKRPGEEKHFFMIVVPGDRQFDKAKLREATGYTDVRFATETEVGEITNGVLPGGVPPWGTLFGLEVHADEHVFDNERIIFNAGDRRVSIAMLAEDYRRLVAPVVAPIS